MNNLNFQRQWKKMHSHDFYNLESVITLFLPKISCFIFTSNSFNFVLKCDTCKIYNLTFNYLQYNSTYTVSHRGIYQNLRVIKLKYDLSWVYLCSHVETAFQVMWTPLSWSSGVVLFLETQGVQTSESVSPSKYILFLLAIANILQNFKYLFNINITNVHVHIL